MCALRVCILFVCVFRGVSLLTLTLYHPPKTVKKSPSAQWNARMHVHYAYARTYTHVYGYVSVHYCTHTRTYGGVGFRNENVSQVEILPQLFHPHTYATPTPHLSPPTPTYTPPSTTPTTNLPLTPQTLDITTFSLHSHYIPTHPCILSYTHAYNIIRKHNPPIGGHGFRIFTFSTSITPTYRIPSETDPRTP